MKTGDKIRIMTSSEYKKYVANHDVPDLFTGTFAEKYMGKQGLIKETYVGTTGITWCKVSTGRSTYPWPDYMLIKLSDKMQPRISGRVDTSKLSISAELLKQIKDSPDASQVLLSVMQTPENWAKEVSEQIKCLSEEDQKMFVSVYNGIKNTGAMGTQESMLLYHMGITINRGLSAYYSRRNKMVVTIQDVAGLLRLRMVSFDDFANTIKPLIDAPELFSAFAKELLTYKNTKRLERTDQKQSREISALLGSEENASVGINNNGVEIYRAYTVDDLIKIVSWREDCQDLTISPRKDLWIVQYHFMQNSKVCSRETSDVSLVQALYNMLMSVYKRRPLC